MDARMKVAKREEKHSPRPYGTRDSFRDGPPGSIGAIFISSVREEGHCVSVQGSGWNDLRQEEQLMRLPWARRGIGANPGGLPRGSGRAVVDGLGGPIGGSGRRERVGCGSGPSYPSATRLSEGWGWHPSGMARIAIMEQEVSGSERLQCFSACFRPGSSSRLFCHSSRSF